MGRRADIAEIVVPPELRAQAANGPKWERWLAGLPDLTRRALADWDLRVEGPATHGRHSLVLPVRTGADQPATLKLSCGADDESALEHLALQRWHGDGAVRLLRANPAQRIMLLERLGSTDLCAVPQIEACRIVAGLYGRLHVRAHPQLRTLTSYVGQSARGLDGLSASAPIPRRLIDQARSLANDFISDDASTGVLVHGDLHFAKVLAGEREPWLAIGPKPLSGDRHYEPAPMLWHRWNDLVATGDVRSAVRHRFHELVDGADPAEDRASAWVIVRMVLNAHRAIGAADHGRARSDEVREWITRCIAIAKAVQ